MVCHETKQNLAERVLSWIAVSLLIASGLAANAQSITDSGVQLRPLRAVREINDPACGTRWFLVPDAAHPGGPGKLVLRRIVLSSTKVREAKGLSGAFPADTANGPIVPPPAVIIRGGDRLIVEQSSAVLEARFSAVALEPAVRGQLLQARLDVDGKAVWVQALSPGHASLAPVGAATR
ncbi:MAG TPA: hypothetical protein VMV57_10940 [Terracidiphilus sp.]|nr:hypothetical protein [Terracidiphilus sp.]